MKYPVKMAYTSTTRYGKQWRSESEMLGVLDAYEFDPAFHNSQSDQILVNAVNEHTSSDSNNYSGAHVNMDHINNTPLTHTESPLQANTASFSYKF